MVNGCYRACRFSVPAGQTARHTHSAPVVVVQTGAGSGTGAGQRFFGFKGPPSWGYLDANETHDRRDRAAVPIEFVEVEVRQPRSQAPTNLRLHGTAAQRGL